MVVHGIMVIMVIRANNLGGIKMHYNLAKRAGELYKSFTEEIPDWLWQRLAEFNMANGRVKGVWSSL